MDIFQSQIVGDVTVDNLGSLTIPELAALYREITGKTTARFETNIVGVSFCREALAAMFLREKTGIQHSRLGKKKLIDYPYQGWLKTGILQYGTRKDLVNLLLQNPTIDECLALVSGRQRRPRKNKTRRYGDDNYLRDILCQINRFIGYGIKEENGRLRLIDGRVSARPISLKGPDIIVEVPSPRKPSDAQSSVSGSIVVDSSGVVCRSRRAPHPALVLAGCAAPVSCSANAGGREEFGPAPGELDGDSVGSSYGSPGRVYRGEGNTEQGRGDNAQVEDRGTPETDLRSEQRFPVRIHVTTSFVDRLRFLMKQVRAVDEEEILIRALEYYDRAVCASVIEKSTITLRGRDGSLEDFRPL